MQASFIVRPLLNFLWFAELLRVPFLITIFLNTIPAFYFHVDGSILIDVPKNLRFKEFACLHRFGLAIAYPIQKLDAFQ